MEIVIKTENPEFLQSRIFEKVEEGTLNTWKKVDYQAEPFLTKKETEIKDAVLLELNPEHYNEILRVTATYNENTEEPSETIVATYLGRFASAIMTHFYEDIRNLEISVTA
jgi:hypothetical protein